MFNGVCIILGLPIAQKLYNKLFSYGKEIKIWHRLTIGIVLAAFAILIAGGIETARLQDICDCGIHRHNKGRLLYRR